MGHYGSEMDPRWDELSPRERMLAAIDDPEVQALASGLYGGFNTTSGLDGTHAIGATKTTIAIDALIKKRIQEALEGVA